MPRLIQLLAVLLLVTVAVRPATAQEIGETVSLTGCLAQDEEDGEFVLEGSDLADVDEIELIPGEGIDMAPHVGHTVEATGVVVADDDEDEEQGEEEEAEEEEENELHLRVTELGHVAASCEGGR